MEEAALLQLMRAGNVTSGEENDDTEAPPGGGVDTGIIPDSTVPVTPPPVHDVAPKPRARPNGRRGMPDLVLDVPGGRISYFLAKLVDSLPCAPTQSMTIVSGAWWRSQKNLDQNED